MSNSIIPFSSIFARTITFHSHDHHGIISRLLNNMRAMTKSALAKAAGVTRKTLMKWLKEPFMQQQLAQFSLSPHQKKLPGKLVKIICEHYVIDLD